MFEYNLDMLALLSAKREFKNDIKKIKCNFLWWKYNLILTNKMFMHSF